jgi:hypothetical protein
MQQISTRPGASCKKEVDLVVFATPETVPGANCNSLSFARSAFVGIWRGRYSRVVYYRQAEP